jgi:transcriptional regulator with XRE-family HTH domain
MTFGENIRQWRVEKKIGLRAFANIIGLSPTFISKMERGIGPLPGEETICKMAEFFGKDPDALLAMADKVASDVKAVIIKQPAYAHFVRETANLTKEQLEAVFIAANNAIRKGGYNVTNKYPLDHPTAPPHSFTSLHLVS